MTAEELEIVYLIKYIYGLDANPICFERDDNYISAIWFEIPDENGEYVTKKHVML